MQTATILDDIVASRADRVREAKSRVPLEALARAAEARSDFRSFRDALSLDSPHAARVIAEMKKASPSAGLLRSDYAPPALARDYEASGAVALSVLTEEDYFQGSLDHLREARRAARLPVLRKDFIIDPYQVYESAASGADALLLIVAALSSESLRDLIDLCRRLKVAALVEVHNEDELSRALDAGVEIVGVNNRDLKTLEVKLGTSFKLREKIPSRCLAVAESGIKTGADLKRLVEAGFHAALIGERLMRSNDPGGALGELLAGARGRQE
ncbi:MAG TPA: indole-3-glycerol phosphate synthase TrpC [Terriglobia bacterium]|nr:indole-3-glycerol phosphate synthase TrpC [Terriglobia bacterium]